MAYSYLTLLDIAKMNGVDPLVATIEENVFMYPEAALFPARKISGTSTKSLVRTAYPKPAFRKANEGVEPKKSTWANKTFECFYFDGQMEMDKAVATADDKGQTHALEQESSGMYKGLLQLIGMQTWYGSLGSGKNDANGFPGAIDVYDATNMAVDAGGTTAGTGSSVWAVKFGTEFSELILGNDTVLNVGTWREQTITRGSKEMTAWKNSAEGWIGQTWQNVYTLARIKKLTADSGKGLTGLLLSQLVELMADKGMWPDALFMSPRSLFQYQRSLTPTGPNQTAGEAPLPTQYLNIPIIQTKSILNTETLTW